MLIWPLFKVLEKTNNLYQGGDGDYLRIAEPLTYNGVPYLQIIKAWTTNHFGDKDGVSRHEASILLARDLYSMTDRDKKATLALLLAQPWVKQIVDERQGGCGAHRE